MTGGVAGQERRLNAAQRVGLCPSKQTLWANQLISATLEEEWRRYQASQMVRRGRSVRDCETIKPRLYCARVSFNNKNVSFQG